MTPSETRRWSQRKPNGYGWRQNEQNTKSHASYARCLDQFPTGCPKKNATRLLLFISDIHCRRYSKGGQKNTIVPNLIVSQDIPILYALKIPDL